MYIYIYIYMYIFNSQRDDLYCIVKYICGTVL